MRLCVFVCVCLSECVLPFVCFYSHLMNTIATSSCQQITFSIKNIIEYNKELFIIFKASHMLDYVACILYLATLRFCSMNC